MTLSRLILLVAIALASEFSFAAEPQKPLRVYILAGQSNMVGQAKMSLLEYQVKQPGIGDRFKHLQKNGQWIEREDVWIKFFDRKGKLTVGYGANKAIGPELDFGFTVGDRYEEQVLLIKVAWGGRSLFKDFRSPSAGLPAQEHLDKLFANSAKSKKPQTMDEIKATFGASYRAMLEEVSSTLKDLKTHFPQYQGQGYVIAGFIWFQGWNDMIDDVATAQYAENLAHFIRDVRKDLKLPKLPFVIGQMGVDGLTANEKTMRFKAAQAAVAEILEFKNNVSLVKTDLFWDVEAAAVFKKGWKQNIEAWNRVGSDFPFHYLGSAKTLCDIGKAMAEAAIALSDNK